MLLVVLRRAPCAEHLLAVAEEVWQDFSMWHLLVEMTTAHSALSKLLRYHESYGSLTRTRMLHCEVGK